MTSFFTKKQEASNLDNSKETLHQHSILLSYLQSLECDVDRNHGEFDFICTHPDQQCERLVCSDCSATNSRHMQQHGQYFMRIPKFLNLRVASSKEKTKMVDLNAFIRNNRNFSKHIDDDVDDAAGNLKLMFRAFEDEVCRMIKNSLRQKFRGVLSNLTIECEREKAKLMTIYDECGKIVSLSDLGMQNYLYQTLQNQSDLRVIRTELDKLIKTIANYDEQIVDIWTVIKRAGYFDSGLFKPKVTFKNLKYEFAQLEKEVNRLLEEFVSDSKLGLSPTKKQGTSIQQTIGSKIDPSFVKTRSTDIRQEIMDFNNTRKISRIDNVDPYKRGSDLGRSFRNEEFETFPQRDRSVNSMLIGKPINTQTQPRSNGSIDFMRNNVQSEEAPVRGRTLDERKNRMKDFDIQINNLLMESPEIESSRIKYL